MKLFHGTRAGVVAECLVRGICPRGLGPSNWDAVPSSTHRVYLTETYAPYFANNAAGKDENWALFEVDLDRLDPEMLVPDEDVLAQAVFGLRRAIGNDATPEMFTAYWQLCDAVGGVPKKGESLSKYTLRIRPRVFELNHLWEYSLRLMGTLSHVGPIPPEAFVRATVFNPYLVEHAEIRWASLDPSITIMNYSLDFLRQKYQGLTEEVFEKGVSVEF